MHGVIIITYVLGIGIETMRNLAPILANVPINSSLANQSKPTNTSRSILWLDLKTSGRVKCIFEPMSIISVVEWELNRIRHLLNAQYQTQRIYEYTNIVVYRCWMLIYRSLFSYTCCVMGCLGLHIRQCWLTDNRVFQLDEFLAKSMFSHQHYHRFVEPIIMTKCNFPMWQTLISNAGWNEWCLTPDVDFELNRHIFECTQNRYVSHRNLVNTNYMQSLLVATLWCGIFAFILINWLRR